MSNRIFPEQPETRIKLSGDGPQTVRSELVPSPSGLAEANDPAKAGARATRQRHLDQSRNSIREVRAELLKSGKGSSIILVGDMRDFNVLNLSIGYMGEDKTAMMLNAAESRGREPMWITSPRGAARDFFNACEPGVGDNIVRARRDGFFAVVVAAEGGLLAVHLPDNRP